MLMKGSLTLIFAIILLNCVKNECATSQCYSCSNCGNSTLSNMAIITTSNDAHQCIKIMIATGENPQTQQLINRGASTQCRPFRSGQVSILCCHSNLCNA
ncbi:unnamed protein product [Rotaria magnacalcarata]|uniref:Uncharacterized protein n=1 Tax=Rotaria magnacalcarata TaxID=392030 RepID=A0A816K7H6_9BILA|nr:unnamed protein product [Rotaria magnacalcarata]CAF1585040.1 unnamed protein product [Rotaria magnacalcarata]CAF1920762.1 unnamed protein product [Rotaria magnacalcarata]CAF2016180.1 unnamed protein product [Rotaria magnacalcarata]CAF2130879.1 unnamed protein product [Rotaria magnacalcarata]